MNTPTTQEMVILFAKVNRDCMRDGNDSVAFSDVDYYAEQIEILYEVSEIRAYELAQQIKEAVEMENICPKCGGLPAWEGGDIAHIGVCFEPVGDRCNMCDGVVRQFMIDKGQINDAGQRIDCVVRAQAKIEREAYLLKAIKPEMAIGFFHITAHTLFKVLEELIVEGTCYLAYDNPQSFIQEKIYELQPEVKALHNSKDKEDDERWQTCDFELIEASVGLMAMRLACTEKLFWCSACGKISSDSFACTHGKDLHYGIDFTSLHDDMYDEHNTPLDSSNCEIPEFKSMDELAVYCIENIGSKFDELTVRVNAEINADDSSDGQYPQSFEYRITGAGDHHVLEAMVKALQGWGYTVTFKHIK